MKLRQNLQWITNYSIRPMNLYAQFKKRLL